ncbi:predicted protein [Sclerotinia sclerotiorum 1980 UF-70]|uniref:Uncharacterized protein n=1 Tax=Sclerotinia sclerotiorum (strain ATCC 18683 / 1980 / Ss-1) TaxID=665079 RepID=A7EU80_SCLS1|nr:predicted protein [Sclerotinia sclerotiorum 1980 UF-70]EDN93022.1 predicted protein [Sclerotinia sclerotiorum 1980 UF-70]
MVISMAHFKLRIESVNLLTVELQKDRRQTPNKASTSGSLHTFILECYMRQALLLSQFEKHTG